MSVFSRLKNLFFSCTAQLTQPSEDRPLFRTIRERKVRRIVEIGVGTGQRALRILEAAGKSQRGSTVYYTGIDLFESRNGDEGRLSLKEAYRKLRSTKANVRLVPGDPCSALARVANSLPDTELVIVSLDQQSESLDRAWFYVPRLLSPNATVFMESTDPQTGEPTLQPLSRHEVESLAGRARPRRAA